MDNATLASGLVTSFMMLRAAKKLIGIASNVPKVVASSARKTVSMILFQVSSPLRERWGVPTLVRVMARMS